MNREEKEFYQVDVIASDFGNPRKSTTFSIQVQLLDVNDEKPVFDNIPNNCEIVENSAAQTGIFDNCLCYTYVSISKYNKNLNPYTLSLI